MLSLLLALLLSNSYIHRAHWGYPDYSNEAPINLVCYMHRYRGNEDCNCRYEEGHLTCDSCPVYDLWCEYDILTGR